MRRFKIVVAWSAGLLIAGACTASAVPLPNPDPCAAQATGTMTSAKIQAYDKCRFDRLEQAIPGNQTVTVTATPAPVTVTVTATPVSSAPATTSASTTTAVSTTAASTTAPATTTPASTTTTTTQPPAATWPDATNTGVPTGVTLTPWAGPVSSGACFITANATVIDGNLFNCDVVVDAQNVTIKNSKVNGLVVVENESNPSGNWSATIQDSEVDGGQQQRATVSGTVTILRSNIHGGTAAAQCDEFSPNCLIQDSWLHGQYYQPGSDWHLDGFLSNGTRNLTIRHNTVACDSPGGSNGGCTGDINLIPNFAAIDGALIENNLLKANTQASYCTYGGEKPGTPTPNSHYVVYRNNVFERGSNNQCGTWGPVVAFNSAGTGNQWVNNKYTDGATVDPVN